MLFDSRCNWGCWTKTNDPFQILRKKEHIWDRHSPVHEKQGDYLQDMWMDGSIYIRVWLGRSQCALPPVDRPISEGHNYTIPLSGIVTMEWDAAFTCNSKMILWASWNSTKVLWVFSYILNPYLNHAQPLTMKHKKYDKMLEILRKTNRDSYKCIVCDPISNRIVFWPPAYILFPMHRARLKVKIFWSYFPLARAQHTVTCWVFTSGSDVRFRSSASRRSTASLLLGSWISASASGSIITTGTKELSDLGSSIYIKRKCWVHKRNDFFRTDTSTQTTILTLT